MNCWLSHYRRICTEVVGTQQELQVVGKCGHSGKNGIHPNVTLTPKTLLICNLIQKGVFGSKTFFHKCNCYVTSFFDVFNRFAKWRRASFEKEDERRGKSLCSAHKVNPNLHCLMRCMSKSSSKGKCIFFNKRQFAIRNDIHKRCKSP